MRTISYNSIRLTLLEFKQRRVALVHGTKMMVLLILAGFSWQSAVANIMTGTRVGNLPAHVLGMKNQAAPPAGVTYWVTAQLITTPANATEVKTGDQIRYTINVVNTTGAALSGVKFIDSIPANTTYLTGTGPGTETVPGVLVSYAPLSVPTSTPASPYTFSFSVLVGAIPPTVGYINHTSYVDFGDGTLLPMPATSGTATPPVYPEYAISVPAYNGLAAIAWKSQVYTPSGANGFVQAGDSIHYTIWVRNTGDLTLTNIVVSDFVPSYTGFMSVYDGGTKDVNDLITWNIPSLAKGQQVTVSFAVRVVTDLTGASAIENTASVDPNNGKAPIKTVSADASGTEPSALPQGNKAATTIAIKSITSFETWKVGVNDNDNNSPTIGPGEDITYVIYVRNTGNISIPVITINDIIPTGTTFKKVFDGGAFNPGDDVKTVNWEIPNIAAGAVASVSFTVTVDEHVEGLKSITNIAKVNKGDTTLETIGCDPSQPSCITNKKGFTMQLAGTRADLFISNVVTPNGDGKNDYFIVRGIKEKYRNSALYIYNRWGNEVYQSKDYQNTWGASGLSEGTYYYVLDLNDNGTIKKYKGWVMIIR
jgi:gliding motility-associated-like protein/uncharacterized repeat protein (TIGR01451 family)